MQQIFQTVQGPKRRYNNFSLGAEVLTSGQIGKLIPIQCDEVVPGDRFKQNISYLMRFSPLSAPAMVRFNVHFHSFYVPYRIITQTSSPESTYEKLIRKIGKPTAEIPKLPYLTTMSNGGFHEGISIPFLNFFRVGTLSDYLGFPVAPSTAEWGDGTIFDTGFPEELRVSLMPFLAYQKIWNDIYRRDQIEKELAFPIDCKFVNANTGESEYNSEPDETLNQESFTVTDFFTLRTRNYERDYFTSALPEPQFGDEVSMGSADIEWLWPDGYGPTTLLFGNNDNMMMNFPKISNPAMSSTGSANYLEYNTNNMTLSYYNGNDYVPSLFNLQNADGTPWFKFNLRNGDELASHLKANSVITINEFRLAMQLQGLLEQINRSGTRYLEIMKSVYGVTVPDARLQRPVYLGGCKSPVTIGTVVQTSESALTPQGTLTGKAQSTGGGNLFSMGYEFEEHGYLITIMSVTPRTSYFGGMPRKFLKKYPEDFYIPNYDHLGEQEITVGELTYEVDHPDQALSNVTKLFGYTPRYAELKSKLSSVHGEFRTTLQNWHVARNFYSNVALNPDFIKAEPEDFNRLFEFENIENTSNEHFQAMIYLDTVAKRNMSKYSTPYTLY